VSWRQADAAVDAALAAGARMMGGGFGGCVLALLAVSLADSVMTSVMRCFTRHDWRAPGFLSAVPSACAHRLRVSHEHTVM
jgi:galactokinase